MNKKIVSGILSLAMVAAMNAPALADTSVAVAGGTGSVPVNLTAAAATFSVTVPTGLLISVNEQGVVTCATEAKIVNNSHGAVKVTNMTIASKNSWATVDFDQANMAAEKVGSKNIAIQICKEKTTGANAISFDQQNWPKLDGKNDTTSDEMTITYDAKVPAQSAPISGAGVADVIFTIGWDTQA